MDKRRLFLHLCVSNSHKLLVEPIYQQPAMEGLLLKDCKKVDRPISTPRLNILLCLHLVPINQVVFLGSNGEILSWGEFRAYMLSALISSERSYSTMP